MLVKEIFYLCVIGPTSLWTSFAQDGVRLTKTYRFKVLEKWNTFFFAAWLTGYRPWWGWCIFVHYTSMLAGLKPSDEELWLLELIDYNRHAPCFEEFGFQNFHPPCQRFPKTEGKKLHISQTSFRRTILIQPIYVKIYSWNNFLIMSRNTKWSKCLLIPQALRVPSSLSSPSTSTSAQEQLPEEGSGKHWESRLDTTTLRMGRTRDCFKAIEFHPCLAYNLPPRDAVAGVVIKHALGVVKKILEKNQPATIKIGFTHNPEYRWDHSTYGYNRSKDRWEQLTVLYCASELMSPAFLEAALIALLQGS